jgi:hypothetical protein
MAAVVVVVVMKMINDIMLLGPIRNYFYPLHNSTNYVYKIYFETNFQVISSHDEVQKKFCMHCLFLPCVAVLKVLCSVTLYLAIILLITSYFEWVASNINIEPSTFPQSALGSCFLYSTALSCL